MAGTAFKDARVVEAAKAFDPVLVDITAQSELAAKYAIQVTPTVIYAAPDGTGLVMTIDAVTADEILADMASAQRPPESEAGDAK